MTINRTIIKGFQNTYRRLFPKDLVHYLMVTYGEEPFPYEFSEQDLYKNIQRDIDGYYAGELHVYVKSPYKRLQRERDQWRKACIDAEVANERQQSYIQKLESLLMKQGIITDRMKARLGEEERAFL